MYVVSSFWKCSYYDAVAVIPGCAAGVIKMQMSEDNVGDLIRFQSRFFERGFQRGARIIKSIDIAEFLA